MKNWETPSFSPNILLPVHNIEKSNLEYTENYFGKINWTNNFIKKSPYFNFLNDNDNYMYNRIKKLCNENGWTIEKEPLRINFIRKLIKIELQEGWNYKVIKIKNGILPDEYKNIIKESFDIDQDGLLNIEKVFNKDLIDTYVVLIEVDNKNCIAGGAVSIDKTTGFMSWGAVSKAYRSRGVHRILLSIISEICNDRKIETCAYVTRNPLIINKSHEQIKLFICRKNISV